MKSELCFFLQTPKGIAGTQYLLLYLASYIAEKTPIPTYFINSNVTQYAPKVSSRLNLCDVDSFDFCVHSDAVYITTTNYLFYLLAKIEQNEDAKVFCISNFAAAYDSLINQIDSLKGKTEEIMQLLDNESACAFVNKSSFNTVRQYLAPKEQMTYLSEVGNFTDVGVYQPVNHLCTDRIRIGWYGTIAENTRFPLQSLLNNLIRFPQKKKIDLHIVGDGGQKWALDYSVYAPQIRFVFAPLTGEDEQDMHYLRENVDVVFSYGTSAVHTAAHGIPTVVVPLERRSYNDDRYVFFHELTPGVLTWNVKELWAINVKTHTVADILDKIYAENTTVTIGEACYNYYADVHAAGRNAQLLLEMVEKCTLTVKKCLNLPIIKDHIFDYHAICDGKTGFAYPEYHEYIREKNSKKAKKLLPKLRLYYQKLKKYIKANCPLILQIKRRISYMPFWRLQYQYKAKAKRIAVAAKETNKVKVAFVLVFNSVFPTRPVFEAMLENSHFDPYVVVVPNTSRGHRYQMQIYNEAVTALKQQYADRVIEGYCEESDTYLELKDEFKIIFFCNPYPKLVHRFHSLDYFLDKNVLTIYANYGFAALSFWDEVLTSEFYNKVWLACIETDTNLRYLKKHQQISGINGVVTGYLKMDKMAKIVPEYRERKRIIISPHHTVWGWSTLNIGNFLKYYDYFKELPKRYPEIDFIFRPHPLLFSNLIAHKLWTQEQIDAYIAEWEQYPNAKYDHEGDYMEQFVNSDAMIHDCGSFIGEYLYTEKPCCYMLKTEAQTREGLVPLGQKCMDNYYKAFSEEDITAFIEDVVLRGNDPMKQQRENFARTELKFNYPNATQELIQMLEEKLF